MCFKPERELRKGGVKGEIDREERQMSACEQSPLRSYFCPHMHSGWGKCSFIVHQTC
jgi:hypothetical protein